jgi:hypothetical protein
MVSYHPARGGGGRICLLWRGNVEEHGKGILPLHLLTEVFSVQVETFGGRSSCFECPRFVPRCILFFGSPCFCQPSKRIHNYCSYTVQTKIPRHLWYFRCIAASHWRFDQSIISQCHNRYIDCVAMYFLCYFLSVPFCLHFLLLSYIFLLPFLLSCFSFLLNYHSPFFLFIIYSLTRSFLSLLLYCFAVHQITVILFQFS